MSPSNLSSSLILLFLLLQQLASTISAHNITRILDRDPDFSNFNDLLTNTHLVAQINNRRTITVLAVPNGNIGDLSSKPVDAARAILMSHIVLDYYDILKLQKMKGKSSILTTLYQTTGVASYGQGFLNVTEDKTSGQIVFGSAVKGAPHNVNYLGTVDSLPYNISVLSVSAPIVVPGIDGQPLRPVALPPTSNAPVPKAAPAPPTEAPASTEAPVADAPAADSPAPTEDSQAPAADAPASSPSVEGPTADDASDKGDAPASSALKKHLASSSLAFLLVFVSLIFDY